MSWFLSITNFDELKMVPEGQTHVHGTSPRVVVYMLCAGARHCPENISLSKLREARVPLTPRQREHGEVPHTQRGPGQYERR